MRELVLKNVAKSYGGVHALKSVDLTASAGEIHGLIGENGAGKSTLIKILAGAQKPDTGTVVWDGEELSLSNPVEAVRKGIAAVFQELSLIPDLTVAQNIWFKRESLSLVGSVRAKKLYARTEELFASLDLPDIGPDRVVSTLTVGEKQLVEIAKAISTNPQILILDEATSALSHAQTEWLLAMCRRLASEGVLIFFISHRMREVRNIANRITVLRNGDSVGSFEMGEKSDDEIVTLMLGRRIAQLFPEKSTTPPGAELLRAEALSVGHRLRSASMSLRAGEIVGIGGLQGQGQVTLLSALAGAIGVDGQILIEGEPKSFSNPRDAMRAGIGIAYVPEDRKTQGLLLAKSIRMNLTLASLSALSRFGFVNKAKESEVVDRLIADNQIKVSSPEALVSSLSGGNQQKVVIAKALETHAKILLLFDLTRGVDVGTKSEIFKMMQGLASEGYGLLFYSTDLEELAHVCHRVLVMSGGEIVKELQGADLSDEAILAASVGADEVKTNV